MRSLFAGFLSLLALTACSRLDLAFSWADWAILRETDSYFDLTDEQSDELRSQIKKDLQQIKSQDIPEVATYFRKMASEIENNSLTAADVEQNFDSGQQLFRKLMSRFHETAIHFAGTAGPVQIEKAVKKYNKKTTELAEDVETPKERMKKERKRHLRWSEEWLDDLTSAQEKVLDDHLQASPFPWELHLKNRDHMLTQFLKFRKDPAKLRESFNNMNLLRDPDYQKALMAYHDRLRAYIVKLYQSLTPFQKKYLVNQLNKRAFELEAIAKKAN